MWSFYFLIFEIVHSLIISFQLHVHLYVQTILRCQTTSCYFPRSQRIFCNFSSWTYPECLNLDYASKPINIMSTRIPSLQVRTFEAHCGSLSQYGMKHMRSLANICNAGIKKETMAEVSAQACLQFPSNPWSSIHKGFSAWCVIKEANSAYADDIHI